MNKHLKILERYIPCLEQIVKKENEQYHEEHKDNPASVERILEELISEHVYELRKNYDLSGPLPVEYMNGKRYYRDDRLKEYRNTEDFSDSIKFDD